MQTGVMKAQGNASPEMLKLNETATARFVELSWDKCRKLAGLFEVLERQPFLTAPSCESGSEADRLGC
jgi:hypothetical protein